MFLNAFGQSINGAGFTFTGIIESRPIVIEGSDGLIESNELYITAPRNDNLVLDTVLSLNITDADGEIDPNETYTIYNIDDDLSGMVNYYIRKD